MEKYSETEVKIVTVIPEKIEEQIVSLTSLKEKKEEIQNQITNCDNEIIRLQTAKEWDENEHLKVIAKHDDYILSATNSKNSFVKELGDIDKLIVDAEALGVKETLNEKPI